MSKQTKILVLAALAVVIIAGIIVAVCLIFPVETGAKGSADMDRLDKLWKVA